MNRLRLVVSVLLLLIGLVWIAQGIGLVGGSAVSGQSIWAWIGAVAGTAGGVLLRSARRPRWLGSHSGPVARHAAQVVLEVERLSPSARPRARHAAPERDQVHLEGAGVRAVRPAEPQPALGRVEDAELAVECLVFVA